MKKDNTKARAVRNVIVAAVNHALEHQLLTLAPPRNKLRAEPVLFTFPDPTDASRTFNARLDDIGYDEIAVSVCQPTDCIPCATAWLERRKGAWLQLNPKSAPLPDHCRASREQVERWLTWDVKPLNGSYADHGPTMA